jgi:TusA-related sulfurtransferase
MKLTTTKTPLIWVVTKTWDSDGMSCPDPAVNIQDKTYTAAHMGQNL